MPVIRKLSLSYPSSLDAEVGVIGDLLLTEEISLDAGHLSSSSSSRDGRTILTSSATLTKPTRPKGRRAGGRCSTRPRREAYVSRGAGGTPECATMATDHEHAPLPCPRRETRPSGRRSRSRCSCAPSRSPGTCRATGCRAPAATSLAGVTVTALALAVGDGLRRARRALAGQRPLRAARPDARVRAARLLASSRDRPGGLGLDARRRLGAAARRRRQRRARSSWRRCSRCSSRPASSSRGRSGSAGSPTTSPGRC